MKTVAITLTDEEHSAAEEAKDGKTWKEAFLNRFEVDQ